MVQVKVHLLDIGNNVNNVLLNILFHMVKVINPTRTSYANYFPPVPSLFHLPSVYKILIDPPSSHPCIRNRCLAYPSFFITHKKSHTKTKKILFASRSTPATE